MWCGVLGPLEVRNADGESVAVGGTARRLLLAALISRVGSTVAPDVLIEDIWGAVPPRSAIVTLRSHIVRLRTDLGRDEAEAVLVTDRMGYRLQLGADDVDASVFEHGIRAGEDDTDPAAALRRLDVALGWWRGDPYVEFPDAAFCVAERVRLVELREHAEERRTDLALALGHAGELVAHLEKRVAASPYRERAWEQLMLALYRSGRQAEALGAYRRASERLVEDLGVDPGPGLRELENRILRQDPDLRLSTPAPVRAARARVAQPDRCPYRGLASYEDADGDVFVGRERLTGQIVGRIAEHRVVLVVGASGTGKSSVLRAGVLPALRHGALPGSAAWRTAVLTPGEVARPQLGGLDLVVVDQAEELFSQLDAAARAETVDALEQFAESGGRVVLALRADFYGRLADIQPFGAYAQAGTVLVGPLRPDELRRVVVEPAERIELTCDPEFIEAVLDDVGAAPAALPLLSAALVRVWRNREGNRLTLDGYRRSGGVASAIEDTAEDAYALLAEDDRPAARRLLVRLAALEGETWVRRSLRRTDLDATDQHALSVLAAARLVSVSSERIELTHEALLEHWPRLRAWLGERALAAEMLGHLGAAAAAWHAAGRPDSDLYRDARLQAALAWRDAHPEDVSPSEGEFLDASAAQARRELDEARERADREARGRRRLRAVVGVLAVVLVLAVAATVLALTERSNARRAATSAQRSALAADARRLAALSVTAPDIATSSLLAVAAYRLQDSVDTRGALLSAVERNQSALWRIQTARRPQRFSITPDGARIALSDNTHTARIFDTGTRRQTAAFTIDGFYVDGMSPDGQQIVTSGQGPNDYNPVGRLAVYDAATHKRVRVLTNGLDPEREPTSSADDRWLAGLDAPAHHAVQVEIWRLANLGARPLTFSVAASPQWISVERSAVAIENQDGSVEVRALPSLRRIGSVPGGGTPITSQNAYVVVSPDGTQVLRGDPNDTRRGTIYGFGRSARPPVALPTQPQDMAAVAFAPDGRSIAIGSGSGSLVVYDTSTGAVTESLSGHAGSVLTVRWRGTKAPTGLYSIGLDSQIISWTVGSGSRLVRFSGPTIAPPDRGEVFGHYVLGFAPIFGNVPSSQERLYLADLDTGSVATWPAGLKDGPNTFSGEYANQAVASRDGKWALVSVNDQTGLNHVDIWDLTAHRIAGTLHFPGTTYRHFVIGLQAAISPDGMTAYSAIDRDHVGVFALPSGRMMRSFALDFPNPDANRVVDIPWQFDPQGRLLVFGYDSGPYIRGFPTTFPTSSNDPINHRFGLLDVKTGRWIVQRSYGNASVHNVAWSPNGDSMALGTYEGTLTTYDAATLQVRSAAGAVEPGYIDTLSYSPDGSTIVTGGTGGFVSFFNSADLSRVGDRLPIGVGANNGGVFAWYDRAGDVVGWANEPSRSPTDLHRWFTFPANVRSLVRTACDLAGADITRDQWQRYVGDRPYRSVCPHSR